MEDTHGGLQTSLLSSKTLLCLNPYYNGRYSWSGTGKTYLLKALIVLILIIMEDTHGAISNFSLFTSFSFVLILIIMEDTHGALETNPKALMVLLS